MKKIMLMLLSYCSINIGQGNASENSGDVALQHRGNSHDLLKNNHAAHNEAASQMTKHKNNKTSNFITEITERYHTSDTRKLDEISDKAFSNENYGEAADTAIVAAILGHSDSQAFIVDAAPDSVKFLTSKNPQSEEALKYYDSKLRTQIKEHLMKQD